MKNLLEEIALALKMNKLRTFLTGFAIAWGIFMLVALLAAGNGLNHGMMQNFNYMSKNSISIYSGSTSIPYKGQKKGRHVKFTPDDIEYFRDNLEDISDFSPSVYKGLNMVRGNVKIPTDIVGVYAGFDKMRNLTIKQGRFINSIDEMQSRKSIVLSEERATKLFPDNPNPVGEYIKLGNQLMFQIVGVYSKVAVGWQEPDYVPFSTVNLLFNPSGDVYQFSFTVNNVNTTAESEAYNDKMMAIFAQRLNFHPDDQRAVWVNSNIESYMQIQSVFSGIAIFIWIIGIGTLIAGVVGVSNIMLVTVKERTREFGIRRAIGATPRSIITLVVAESLSVTLIFGYIGMLFGVILSEVLCMIFPEGVTDPNNPSMFANPTVDLSIVIAATLVLVLAGVIAGYVPARRAASVKPIEAMMAK